MIKKYKDFNISGAQNTGGVTGSKKVKFNDDSDYQLKPSILNNSLVRQLKAGWSDRENFGEVIASRICSALLNKGDFEAIPVVDIVYDDKRQRINIASKYLQGDKIRTLDDYAKGRRAKYKRHAEFLFNHPSELSKGKINLENPILKKDLARAIVASILVGDHDINPGNMIVVTKGKENRIARIDFGHAFNDLLNAPEAAGGQVRNKVNRVIDFINREEVAGIPAFKSKLWRDYPDIVPSSEMVASLEEIAQMNGVQHGIDSVKNEFVNLVKILDENKDSKGKEHVKKTLIAINNNISSEILGHPLTVNEVIDKAFNNISIFCQQNQQMMLNTAKLMQLQVDIDNLLLNKSPTTNAATRNIVKNYRNLTKKKNVTTGFGDLQWLKTSSKVKAFEGNIKEYIEYRSKELGVKNNLDIDKYIAENPLYIIPKAFRNFLKKPILYSGSMILGGVAMFTAASILTGGLLPAVLMPAAGSIALISGIVGAVGGYKFANTKLAHSLFGKKINSQISPTRSQEGKAEFSRSSQRCQEVEPQQKMVQNISNRSKRKGDKALRRRNRNRRRKNRKQVVGPHTKQLVSRGTSQTISRSN